MKKIKLFVDFDGVILNTSLFNSRLFDAFFRMGYEMKDIKTTYMLEGMDNKYNPSNHLQRLVKIKPTSLKLADSRLAKVFSDIRSMLYDDVEQFFKNIDTEVYEVNILTVGEEKYQLKKIENANIKNKISNIYITDQEKWKHLSSIVSEMENFILIDDLADTLEEIKRNFPKSFCLQIVRQDLDMLDAEAHYKDVYEGIKIKCLPEAIKYLSLKPKS